MNPKIEQALSLLTGSPASDFAELAILAADQAGLSAAAQRDLRAALECQQCGDVHGPRCNWAETCEECDRDDAEMARERLCVDCEEHAKKMGLVQKLRDDFEGFCDALRDEQKAGLSRRDADYYASGENWRSE